MRDTVYSCFDVETTGLDPGLARVIEVAVVRISPTGEVVGEWTTLVDAGIREFGASQRIHGIQPGWLDSAPTFTEIAGDLAEELFGFVPVAHNASFDVGFLEAEWNRLDYDCGPMALTALDTLTIARREGLPGRLGLLAEALEVAMGEAHQALDDSRTLAGVVTAFIERGIALHGDDQQDGRVQAYQGTLLRPEPSGRTALRPGSGQATGG